MPVPDAPSPERLDVRLNRTHVTVLRSRIEDVLRTFRLDAVVSSDDTRLSMSGGVSAAIRKLAGPELVQEAQGLVPLRVGDIAVTRAGALPLRHVLHAITLDLDNNVVPAERTIGQLGRGILVRCEALGIRRVAMPAIGTGAARFPAEVTARILTECLLEHLHNETALEHVVLVLLKADTFAHFLQMLREAAQKRIGEAAAGAMADEASGAASPWTSLLRGIDNFVHVSTAPIRTRGGSAPRGSPETEAAPDARAVLAGRYVLLEELGRGGFGVVYLAWDLVLRRVVAIKRLKAAFGGSESLRREAAIAMGLSHEGVVRVHHFEPRPDEGGPFLVMEYLAWPTAEKWIADAGDSRLPVRAVLDVGLQLCEALAYAHDRGVLHLDIKPGNVFVDEAAEKAKLSDFGISKVAAAGGKALQLTPVGTPRYMAPEQVARGGKLSAATDLFQLAATLWDCLTGQPPSSPPDKLGDGLEPERAAVLDVLSPALDALPARRPRGARELAEMLAGALTST
jgi:O-acetyl-ADP-ribose deacetylase (regulator of RNase III)